MLNLYISKNIKDEGAVVMAYPLTQPRKADNNDEVYLIGDYLMIVGRNSIYLHKEEFEEGFELL